MYDIKIYINHFIGLIIYAIFLLVSYIKRTYFNLHSEMSFIADSYPEKELDPVTTMATNK